VNICRKMTSILAMSSIVVVSLMMTGCTSSSDSSSADPTVLAASENASTTAITSVVPAVPESAASPDATADRSTEAGGGESTSAAPEPESPTPTAPTIAVPEPLPAVFDLRSSFDLDGDGRVDRITITSMGAGSASAIATLSAGGTYDLGVLHPMQGGSMVSLSCTGSQLTVQERVDSGGRITVHLTDLVGVGGVVIERPQSSFDVTSMPLPTSVVASDCR